MKLIWATACLSSGMRYLRMALTTDDVFGDAWWARGVNSLTVLACLIGLVGLFRLKRAWLD